MSVCENYGYWVYVGETCWRCGIENDARRR